jgi:peptidoglycan/LPS O-acetylase OafA/YrhL
LITKLLTAEFEDHDAIDFKRFFKNRLLRLSPPFLVTLLLANLLAAAKLLHGRVTLDGVCAQLLYLANYYAIFWNPGDSVAEGTEVFWSLAVEEHFYIAYPFALAWMFGRLPRITILQVLGVACVVVLVWRCWLVFQPGFSSDRTYYATDTRIDSILFGCFFAVWFEKRQELLESRIGTRHCVALLAAGAAILLISMVVRSVEFRETLRYSMQGIAIMPIFIVLLAYRRGPIHLFLNTPALDKLGEYSYAFYLGHYIVEKLIVTNLPDPWRLPNIVLYLAVVCLSFAYAKAMNTWIERPVLKWRSRMPQVSRPAHVSVAGPLQGIAPTASN